MRREKWDVGRETERCSQGLKDPIGMQNIPTTHVSRPTTKLECRIFPRLTSHDSRPKWNAEYTHDSRLTTKLEGITGC